jgi:hypothetical protein
LRIRGSWLCASLTEYVLFMKDLRTAGIRDSQAREEHDVAPDSPPPSYAPRKMSSRTTAAITAMLRHPPRMVSSGMLDASLLLPEHPRPLKRSEYDRLVALGAFEDERIELLHGVLGRQVAATRMSRVTPPARSSGPRRSRTLR